MMLNLILTPVTSDSGIDRLHHRIEFFILGPKETFSLHCKSLGIFRSFTLGNRKCFAVLRSLPIDLTRPIEADHDGKKLFVKQHHISY